MKRPESMEMGRADRRLPVLDEHGLTESEQRLLQELSPEAKRVLRKLHVPALRKYKERVIGFRSDDLLTLAMFANMGALQVRRQDATTAIMAKMSDNLYLTANPESPLLRQQHPNLLSGDTHTFAEAIKMNRNFYDHIACQQAMSRHILPLVKNMDRFVDDLMRENGEYLNPLGVASSREIVVEESFTAIGTLNKAYLTILAKHTGFSVPALAATIRQFQKREGILLAIDERAAKDLGLGTLEQTDDRGNEIVILAPDGTIPMEYVVGFETIGDFEEGIMERMEDEG